MKKDYIQQIDCLEGMKGINSNTLDAIITDPPYWLGTKFSINEKGQYSGKATDSKHTGKTWKIGDGEWVEEIFKEFNRITKYGGFVLTFAIDRMADLMAYNARKAGFEVCQSVYWKFKQGMPKGTDSSKRVDALLLQGNAGTRSLRKQEFANPTGETIEVKAGNNGFVHDVKKTTRKSKTEPITDIAKEVCGSMYGLACLAPAIEVICVFRKASKNKNIATDISKSLEDREIHPAVVYTKAYQDKYGKFPSQILEVAKPSKEERKGKDHATLKPIKLMEDLILLFTKKGDLVLDPFCGSGTTLEALLRYDRHYIGFDNDAKCHKMANNRLK